MSVTQERTHPDPQVRQNSPENKDGGQILKTGSNDQDEEWEEGLRRQDEKVRA